MTTKLGTLTVDLLAKTGAFETDIKRAARTTERQMTRIANSAAKAGAAIGAGLAAGATAAAVVVKRAINDADELSKAASKVGIPTEVLSELKFAADLSGVAFDSLQSSVGRLIKTQTDAAQGVTRSAEVFKALGISVKDASGELVKTPELLGQVADVFAALPDGAAKSQLAFELFGRAGRDLIPLLNGGSEGIKAFAEEARALGVVVSTETGKQAEQFNDQLTRVQKAVDGAALSVASKLLPSLLETNGPLDRLVSLLKDPGVQEGFSTIISGALNAAGALARFASEVANVTKFAAEEIAFKVTGKASADDIVRLEEQAENLRARLERNGDTIFNTPFGFSPEKRAELEQELKGVEALIKDYYDGIEAQRKRAQALAEGVNAPVAVAAAGIDTEALKQSIGALFSGGESGGGTAGGGRSRGRRDTSADDLRRAIEERDRAAQEFTRTLQDLEAQIGGPLAQAELEWMRRQEQIEDLARRGEISEEQRQKALDATAELRRREIEAMTSQKTAGEELLEDLQFELGLLKLSNVDREIAIALRYANVDAISAEGLAIAESIRKLDEARKQVQAADDVRDAFAGTFASIIDGTKSVKDAFEDLGSYITQLVARRLGDQLVESLFGARGTPLGGTTGGGLFSNILGSLFGGGRAAGGYVAPGKLYQVAENGPELLRVGNRQFLLPTVTGGMVTPNARMGGGVQQHINISVAGQVDMRTREQIAADVSRASQRAVARSY